MMIFGNLSLVITGVVLGSLLLIGRASAQLENHHQQYLEDFNRYVRSDTKALTPVYGKPQEPQISPRLQWSFASTVVTKEEFLPPNGAVPKQVATLLVKLGANFPTTDPFAFEWARELYGWRNKQMYDSFDLDVEDVYYEEDDNEYILCGSVTKRYGTGLDPPEVEDNGRRRLKEDPVTAFLMRVSGDGNTIIRAKVFEPDYEQNPYIAVETFKSVVPHHNGKGYIAVGQTADFFGQYAPKSAAYVSVDKDLDVKCARKLDGSFNGYPVEVPSESVESRFNKVIQYKYKYKPLGEKFKGYAVVGDTTAFYQEKQCARKTDILVVTGDEKCNINRLYQYGPSPPDIPYKKNTDLFGLSIAQADKKKGGLVLTGNAVGCSQGEVKYDDVAVMSLDQTLNMNWYRRYDIEKDNDRGTAVQVKNKKAVLVAGETNTDDLSGNSDVKTKDAFLMEVKLSTGKPYRLDLFGFTDGTDNGALAPGNLDLHLTLDEANAVMMGNTKIAEISTGSPRSYPYLIERYETVEKRCEDAKHKVKDKKDKFKLQKVTNQKFFPQAIEFEVKAVAIKLENDVICEKRFPFTISF